jgi:transposase
MVGIYRNEWSRLSGTSGRAFPEYARKDPLFLASSVFVKRPERLMALAFIMTLCLLVYKLAELRVRQQLAATGLTVPDQVGKPTARPT